MEEKNRLIQYIEYLSINKVEGCKIDTDKINSLEDVKEILGALDLGIRKTQNIIKTNGHDIDKLDKYLK